MIGNIDSIKLLPDKERIKVLEKILSDFEAGAVKDHKEIGDLTERLNDEARALHDANEDCKAKAELILDLTENLREKEAMELEIRELRKEKVVLFDQATLWKTAACRRTDEIKELEEKLGLQTKYSHTKDAEVRELGKDVADLEAKVDFWMKAAASRAATIAGLEQKMKDIGFKFWRPADELTDHSAEMTRLEDQLKEAGDEIEHLREMLKRNWAQK